MTPMSEFFLRSVINYNWWQAYVALGRLAPNELFNAVAALDPEDRMTLRRVRAGTVERNAQINDAYKGPGRLAGVALPDLPPLQLRRIDYALDVLNAELTERRQPQPPAE